MKRFLIILSLTTTPFAFGPLAALASNPSGDDAIKQLFLFHKGIVQELAKDYIEGDESRYSGLPNQKNIPLKIRYVTKTTNDLAVKAPAPTAHTYSTKTVWANLTVHVTDFHGHFNVAVESDTPIDGWIIKRMTSQAIVTKGGENSAFNFAFDVNETFNDDYSLTVMVNKDGMTNPALVPLRN